MPLFPVKKRRGTRGPNGWLGSTVKVDWPILVNLRLDPYERIGLPKTDAGSLAYYNWLASPDRRLATTSRPCVAAAGLLSSNANATRSEPPLLNFF